MYAKDPATRLEQIRSQYPQKFAPVDRVFSHIHRGDRIFIGTACAEPQYLVKALIKYVEAYPKAFFDAEILHVWTLGVAPYTDEKFMRNFRHNSFFISNSTRDAVNRGVADYTPIFLSHVPDLFRRGLVLTDIALVQTSVPDEHGYMSLGVSVDIVKAAVQHSSLVVAQLNSHMPRVHGDGFIHVSQVDFMVPCDEPLLEYQANAPDEIVRQIGKYVSRLIRDGDTIQVGYGRIPNAILSSLRDKRHLGVHSELLSDGIVELMKSGVVDNTMKTVNPGKTVATFCMGTEQTYRYVHDNPAIEFRTIDYTNNPLIIAQHHNMTAINSALEIDLTGQSTAESLGKTLYSGIGGQADFMRGAVMAPGGKTILALQSTDDEGKVSRIVPFLSEGAGVTLVRGDIHYVVTEYGIAYLHGKNVRERAMQLISIAHPSFRPWLIEQAKELNFIYKDQAYIQGKAGEYPEALETYRTTRTGMELLLRPIKLSDEPLLKEFIHSLSDDSMYRRFMSTRQDMPHERLQELVVIDYTRDMAIVAVKSQEEREDILGVGRYYLDEKTHTAEVAIAVRDDYQDQGVGTELLLYVTYLAKSQGFLGITAEVLVENKPMMRLFDKLGLETERRLEQGVYSLTMSFGKS